jgi:hypothetical protein
MDLSMSLAMLAGKCWVLVAASFQDRIAEVDQLS